MRNRIFYFILYILVIYHCCIFNRKIVYVFSNHIIFGIISNIPINLTKYFFKSLERINYKGRIIIFIDKEINVYHYKKLKIEYLFFNNTYPYYPIDHYKYNIDKSFINSTYPLFDRSFPYIYFLWILRYYLIYTFIIHHGKNNEIYLISDVKDVIFQKNPFKWKYKKGIYLIEESKIKSLKEATLDWIKIYTNNESILQNKVINGGIIFGTSKEMKMFLKDYLNGYKNEKKNGVDQAYLNYFFYSKQRFIYPVYLCESNKCFAKCLVQEIRFTNKLLINKTDMRIYNDDGSLPALIHQYTYAFYTGSKTRTNLFRYYRKLLFS